MNNPLLAIQLQAHGLKCDAPGCNHHDPRPTLTDFSIADNIGRPCPQCGANLLTHQDAAMLFRMKRWVCWINIVAFPFMVLCLPITLWKRLRRTHTEPFHCHMNGTGSVRIQKP